MEFIGKGLYTIAEASRYTGAHRNVIWNWFRSDNRKFMPSDFAESDTPTLLSFHDMIDVLVVKQMRNWGLSLNHIRQVHRIFSDKWASTHPFCTRRFYVDVQQKRIIDELKEAQSKILVDAITGQGQIESVIEPSLKTIDYSRDMTNLAIRWRIAAYVIIDPRIKFGKPVIANRRLTTATIAAQYYAYDRDIEPVMEIYRIKKEEVISAVKFEKDKGFVKRAA